MLKVAGIGEILFDVFPEGKQLGGAPCNFVFHSKALGLDAYLVSAVGNDENGVELCEILQVNGLSLQYIQRAPFPTGTVEVSLDKDGTASYLINENVAWDHILWSHSMQNLASEMDAVCFGSLAQRSIQSSKSIHNFLKHTKKDCLRVFDVNLRQAFYSRDIIESSLKNANVLKLNQEELEIIKNIFNLPKSDNESLRIILDRYELYFIALTQGSAGSVMIDPENNYYCPAFPATVKDTVGAGDAFLAAMIMSKLRGLSLDKVNRLAGKVAAYVCSQSGATPSLPDSLLSELKQENMPAQTIENTHSQKIYPQ